jgi:DNA-directed RNA polymerase subunit RPC12/RpoP
MLPRTAPTRAMYICRGCGTEIAYPQRFLKCPVCGIRLN